MKRIAPLIVLALISQTFADPLTFTGHGDISGPPFPSSSIALEVRRADGTPLQALYISLPTASPASGLDVGITSGGFIAHFDSSKLEPYDFPGQYSQRFDGVDLGGDHVQSSVLGQTFSSTAFEALIQLDFPPDAPEEHLYYVLRGRIGEGQAITFSNVSVIASPQGYFDLDLSLSLTGELSGDPVVQVDLVGSTTPLPEPSSFLAIGLFALLAAPRRIRYYLHPNG